RDRPAHRRGSRRGARCRRDAGCVGHRSPVVPSGDDRRRHHADQQEHHRSAHSRPAPRLTVSVAQYLVAVVLVAAIIGALGFGAFEARSRWLPSWHGAPARLAEITGALAVLILVPQLLGT